MNTLRKISSSLLALLVLLASSSFYVGVHVCNGSVNAVAFLQDADGCGHQTMPPCHQALMKGCCEDDLVVHEAQEIKGDISGIAIPAVSSTDILHNTILVSEIIPSKAINPITYFSPPPYSFHGNDIVISIQSLLI